MKKILLSLIAVLVSANISAQKIISGDLNFMKGEKYLKIDIDFSQGTVFGMSAKDFAEVEEDFSKKDRYFMSRLFEGLQGNSEVRFEINASAECKYQVILVVDETDDDGEVYGKLVFTSIAEPNEKLCVIKISGDGGTFGSKINLLGDGLESCGKKMRSIINRKIPRD